jgi:hypothetical protein
MRLKKLRQLLFGKITRQVQGNEFHKVAPMDKG